ncbi:MAG: NAD(P)/FAD-dependent oxidoreductase [Cyanobium sp.]
MTPPPATSSVLVVGAGVIGLMAAWRLAQAGHPVTLIDPALGPAPGAPVRPREHGCQHPEAANSSRQAPHPVSPDQTYGPSDNLAGSQAALGVLMAQVFQRSSGRAWRLRQRSHQLWREWIPELEQRGHRLPRRQGVLLLAASPEDLERQARLAAERARQGLPLIRLTADELAGFHPQLPGPALGGLLSPEDGQLDPGPLLEALRREAIREGVTCLAEAAVALERGETDSLGTTTRPPTSRQGALGPAAAGSTGGPGSGRWRLELASGGALSADWLVLALGLGCEPLLAGLGHPLPLEPVLGQALELELPNEPGWSWPGVVVWRGINLLPRPDLGGGGRRLWLGATLEPGDRAGARALAELRTLGGEAPPWLQQARVVRQWQGLRVRPIGQPAPVLSEPEPGLLVATGHYRNGVLLAPATAEWLGERIGGFQLQSAIG